MYHALIHGASAIPCVWERCFISSCVSCSTMHTYAYCSHVMGIYVLDPDFEVKQRYLKHPDAVLLVSQLARLLNVQPPASLANHILLRRLCVPSLRI